MTHDWKPEYLQFHICSEVVKYFRTCLISSKSHFLPFQSSFMPWFALLSLLFFQKIQNLHQNLLQIESKLWNLLESFTLRNHCSIWFIIDFKVWSWILLILLFIWRHWTKKFFFLWFNQVTIFVHKYAFLRSLFIL